MTDLILIKKYEDILIKLLQKYFIKYMIKIYDDTDTLKDFQLYLYNIPKWTERQGKIAKEYNNFLEKMDYTDNDFLDLLETVFTLNVKLIINLYYSENIDNSYSIDNINIDIPKTHIFWYKCLKNISKYFYEHPKRIKLGDSVQNKLDTLTLLKKTIKKFLPTNKYLNYESALQIKKEKVNYNFNDDNFSSTQSKTALDLEKLDESVSQSEPKLELMTEDKVKCESSDHSEHSDKEEIKQIKLPKYLFMGRKKSNIQNATNHQNEKIHIQNELEENFFD